ncbi:hypothetical protein HAX54_024460 [Datura stramonium]|uniref:Uncharacterized protein n=1 Tax=Datura stramonium TaxID=4076 RepID=A0ABS8UZ87_DATST|nr:hypothetical protein [Datura stramonium]
MNPKNDRLEAEGSEPDEAADEEGDRVAGECRYCGCWWANEGGLEWRGRGGGRDAAGAVRRGRRRCDRGRLVRRRSGEREEREAERKEGKGLRRWGVVWPEMAGDGKRGSRGGRNGRWLGREGKMKKCFRVWGVCDEIGK